MTTVTKNETALSAKRLAPIFRGIVSAMQGGEKTISVAQNDIQSARDNIERLQQQVNAGKALIAKAHATVSDGVFAMLGKLPVLTADQWSADCAAVCRAALEAAGYSKGTVATRLSNIRAAALCYTSGKVKRLPNEAFQPYASRCAKHLSGNGEGNAKGAGRKPRQTSAKGGKPTGEITPMQHALALCGDHVGRAKALVIILKDHVAAFDAFAADVLSK